MSAVRTAVGKFGGALKDVASSDLEAAGAVLPLDDYTERLRAA